MDIDSFLPGVMRQVPGAPEFSVMFAVRDAAIDFCERTRLWTQPDTITLSAASVYNDLIAPDDSDILEISQASYEGRPIKPATQNDMASFHDRYQDPTYVETGTPQRFFQQDQDQIVFVPTDNITIQVVWILRPSEGCTDLPDFLYNKYKRAIEAGAIYRLLDMPGAEWSVPAAVESKRADYDELVARAQLKKSRGVQRAPVRSRGNYF